MTQTAAGPRWTTSPRPAELLWKTPHHALNVKNYARRPRRRDP